MGVQGLIEVCPQVSGINPWETRPAGDQLLHSERPTRHRLHGRDRLAIAGDQQGLTATHARQHVSAAIAQVSDGDHVHEPNVLPVMHPLVVHNL